MKSKGCGNSSEMNGSNSSGTLNYQFMMNSSLNKAHQQERKAEALLNKKKFEECIECHKNAISLFTEAMTKTTDKKVLLSLQLQKKYNEKQIAAVKMQQMQKEKVLKNRNSSLSSFDLESEDGESALKTAIFQNIIVQDSLIDRLERRRLGNENDSSTSDTDDKSLKYDKIVDEFKTLGNKHPKDDRTTIEELKILRNQLQDLVQILVTQLDERNKEIDQLKSRIKHLEHHQDGKNSSLKVVTDSSGGTSPYIFSPCSELSPDVNDLGSLPSLMPLELPKFDYNMGETNNADSANNVNNN
ncbi:nuclear receptor-binding factor 2-like [Coccinella septempunctata]|uniref:nuclear receptor-binding factor 2-like n=1 Tax=Coccinella septempunctata TaxID=41139 RepID=UPI001D088564|nr:nuclear receptor-binding factor 2-like [Coccinella septempunctata]